MIGKQQVERKRYGVENNAKHCFKAAREAFGFGKQRKRCFKAEHEVFNTSSLKIEQQNELTNLVDSELNSKEGSEGKINNNSG